MLLSPAILLGALLAFPATLDAQDPAPERGDRDAEAGVDADAGDHEDGGEGAGSPAEGSPEVGAEDEEPIAPETRAPAPEDPAAEAEDGDVEEPSSEAVDEAAEAPPERALEPPPALAPEADPRVRRARGFAFRLEGGRAMWSLDAGRIEEQVSGELRGEIQSLMVESTHNAPSITLHLGYNILGHATIGAEICATGWDVFDSSRGGGGLAAGTLSWHPAELLAELLPIGLLRQRTWDASFFAGAGWGAVGKDRALRGDFVVLGARAEIYFADWFTLGASVRSFLLRFDEYVVHWDNDEFVTLPDRSGGSLLVPSIAVTMRVPTGS